VARILRDYRGRTISVLAPLVKARKGLYTDLAKWLLAGLRVPAVDVPPRRPRNGRGWRASRSTTSSCRRRDRVSATRDRAARARDPRPRLRKGVVQIGRAARTGKARPRARVLHPARLPQVRHQFSGTRPAPVLVQLQARLCESCYARAGDGRVRRGTDRRGDSGGTRGGKAERSCRTARDSASTRPRSRCGFAGRSIAGWRRCGGAAGQFFKKLKSRRDAEMRATSCRRSTRGWRSSREVGSLPVARPSARRCRAARRSASGSPPARLQPARVCYVLDEPTIGLHPRDNRMLLDTLARLEGKGNTVVGGRARRGHHPRAST